MQVKKVFFFCLDYRYLYILGIHHVQAANIYGMVGLTLLVGTFFSLPKIQTYDLP